MVYDAYRRMKANGGSAGVDGISIGEFDSRLGDNLYKIWNRMSSGSYYPPAVRLHEIPKVDGGKRILGIPTVGDRIAQTVAKMYLEPKVEPHFHPDSYGYRPGKSALEAVGVARQRCWKQAWVIDLDIKGFFDSIDHSLMMNIVQKYTEEKWLLLYIRRWLEVPAQNENGETMQRSKGTPQGGVISPLLANMFLHEAFDKWIKEQFSTVPFERYADDVIVHCRTEKQAKYVLDCIRRRLAQYGLELHPEKTKIVYCKDDKRKGDYECTRFSFLGYEYKSRKNMARNGDIFMGFTPAISPKAKETIRDEIRKWKLTKKTTWTLEDVAARINPVVRGWINYYGAYSRSELASVLWGLERKITSWAMRKYKKLQRRRKAGALWLANIRKRKPRLFAHWLIWCGNS